MRFKERIRRYAHDIGADLVGFGGIDRCRHAPLMMSPQGLFPGAKTVVVMGIHHPDACIELGGETHPQEIGPYSVQYLMNSRLDEMAYRLATFLEKQGSGAIPIASSNIWRYNQYKDLQAVFAPDISHIYMAVAAGLADMGYNGLALTPQYGARNRFVTVITDAEIEEDPLIPPGTVCDNCMLCRTHCPTAALSKEIDGDKILKIADREYRFPNKNLWRCAWGEHFDLDLDLDIPEVVTEQVILDAVKKHGLRSGEMGQCLKFCVPKPLREFDRAYSRTPMRRYERQAEAASLSPYDMQKLLEPALSGGADLVTILTADELRAAGLALERLLPGSRTAITIAAKAPAAGGSAVRFGLSYQMDSLCYDLTRACERLGHRSLMTVRRSGSHPDPVRDENATEFILAHRPELAGGGGLVANTVITRATLPAGIHRAVPAARASDISGLTRRLAEFATGLGADLVGVTSTERVDAIVARLRPLFEGEEILDAEDKSVRFTPWEPGITVRRRRLTTAGDYLPDAKSVLVFGLRMHEKVLAFATHPPAEAVGPYAFQTYETAWLGATLGGRIVNWLRDAGYRAALTFDLTGTDSFTANPRGPQPDLFGNRFAGLAAGLGQLTVSGHLATPAFGLRQRVVAIVTDAPLQPSPLPPAGQPDACRDCGRMCIATCPSKAITATSVELVCEGRTYSFNRIVGRRCDWVKRYALMGDSGFRFLGSPIDVPAPEQPGPVELEAALRRHDPIKKYRPVVAEPCVVNCPLGGGHGLCRARCARPVAEGEPGNGCESGVAGHA